MRAKSFLRKLCSRLNCSVFVCCALFVGVQTLYVSETTAYEPANIVFTCDSEDFQQLRLMMAAMRSVVLSSRQPWRLNFHIFISSGHGSMVRDLLSCVFGENQVFGVEIHPVTSKVDLPIMIRAGAAEERLNSDFNFIRFYVADILGVEVDKLLYLDTDVIALDDVCKLFDTHLVSDSDKILAAAARSSPLSSHLNFSIPEISSSGLSPGDDAFNAGVLLIRTDNWKKQNVTKKIKYWMDLNIRSPAFLLGSQPPLLLSIGQHFEHMNNSWNVDGAGHSSLSAEAVAEAQIIHWSGSVKGCARNAFHRDIWQRFDQRLCFTPPSLFCTTG